MTIGDSVTVDGLQGRGVVMKREGRRLTVQFRNGLTVSRDQAFVHALRSDYKSRYGSLAAGGPGSGRKSSPETEDKKLQAILKKPWKQQTEEERLYVARHDPRQRSLFSFGFKMKKPHFGSKPNPSFRHGKAKHGHFKTSPSLGPAAHWESKILEADAGGEPDVGNYSHAHMEPSTFIYQPPSLRNKRPVPTDDPMEKDDRFLDVTKRKAKDTERQRAELLKHDAPAGNPPLIPARTTLMAPHMGVTHGELFANRIKQKPARTIGAKATRVLLKRGCVRAV